MTVFVDALSFHLGWFRLVFTETICYSMWQKYHN